jgi:hypothetical protein
VGLRLRWGRSWPSPNHRCSVHSFTVHGRAPSRPLSPLGPPFTTRQLEWPLDEWSQARQAVAADKRRHMDRHGRRCPSAVPVRGALSGSNSSPIAGQEWIYPSIHSGNARPAEWTILNELGLARTRDATVCTWAAYGCKWPEVGRGSLPSTNKYSYAAFGGD